MAIWSHFCYLLLRLKPGVLKGRTVCQSGIKFGSQWTTAIVILWEEHVTKALASYLEPTSHLSLSRPERQALQLALTCDRDSKLEHWEERWTRLYFSAEEYSTQVKFIDSQRVDSYLPPRPTFFPSPTFSLSHRFSCIWGSPWTFCNQGWPVLLIL